jgi:hypothetical protein
VKPHDVARFVVQDQVQIVKLQDAVQAARQIVEELAEVAVPGDSLGDFQQNLVLAKRRARGQRFGRRTFHCVRIASGLRQANAWKAKNWRVISSIFCLTVTFGIAYKYTLG